MRGLVFAVLFLLAHVAVGQNEFVFNETGLTPKKITVKVNNVSKTELYQQTLMWLQENYKNSEIQDQNEVITFTETKGNFIQASKNRYHVKYVVKISFEDGQYTLEPLEVFTKLNSKYDMGWKKFDLNDGSSFFKRRKPIKKTKSYVQKIPTLFNELKENLEKALK